VRTILSVDLSDDLLAAIQTDYRLLDLGHADLSTVSRYAHVATDELHEAATRLGERVAPAEREAA
jgi:hypothetical protein